MSLFYLSNRTISHIVSYLLLSPYRKILCVLFVFVIHVSNGYNIPADVFIGGIFRVISPQDNSSIYGNITKDSTAALNVAAFVLAVDQINNKSDNYFDDVLPNTRLNISTDINQRFSYSSSEVNIFLEGSFASYIVQVPTFLSGDIVSIDVVGVVDCLYDESTSSSLQSYSDYKIPVLVTNSTDSDLSHHQNYPYLLRLVPMDAFSAATVYYVLKKFNWNKIALLYTSDNFGEDCYTVFSYVSSQDTFSISYLITETFAPLATDFTSIIQSVKSSGATIIVLLLSDTATSNFLVQAYQNGLLIDGTQVIGVGLQDSLSLLLSSGATDETIPNIMKGYLAVKSTPTLYLNSTEGQSFLNAYTKLSPTITYNNEAEVCSDRHDDTHSIDGYLYQYAPHDSYTYYEEYHVKSVPDCVGVDSFDFNASTLDPSVMYTYTGVLVLAYAIDYLINAEQVVSPENVYDTILSGINVPPASVVGPISFFQGIEASDMFGEGDRFSGHIYTIYNFNRNYFNTIDYSGMVPVAFVNGSNSVLLCPENVYDSPCHDILYRNYDESETPSDSQPNIYANHPKSVKVVFLFFGSMIVIESLASVAMFLYFKDTVTVHNSQMKINVVVILGQVIGGIRVILEGVDVTYNTCVASLWLEHTAYRMIYGSYALKLWRVHKLINTPNFKRVRITEQDVLLYIEYHLTFLILILSIITALNTVELEYFVQTSANQSTYYPICTTNGSYIGYIFLVFLYAYELLTLFSGAYYLYLTRAVPKIINETNVLIPILFTSFVIILVCTVILLLNVLSLTLSSIVVATGFILVIIPSCFYYTLHKYNIVVVENTAKLNKARDRLDTNTTTQGTKAIRSSVEMISSGKSTLRDMKDADYIAAARLVDNERDYIEKIKIVQKNLDIWNAISVKLSEYDEQVDQTDTASLIPTKVQYSMLNSPGSKYQLHPIREDENGIKLTDDDMTILNDTPQFRLTSKGNSQKFELLKDSIPNRQDDKV